MSDLDDAVNAAIDAKLDPVQMLATINAQHLALVDSDLDSIASRLDALEGAEPPTPEGPGILSVVLVPGETSVEVSIVLDVAAPCRTEYRVLGGAWQDGPDETSYTYSTHTQTISGLSPGLDYEVRAIAYDEDGETVGAPQSFTTLTQVPGPQPPPDPEPAEHGPRQAPSLPSGNLIRIGVDTTPVADNGSGDATSQLTSIIEGAPANSTIVFAQGDTTGYQHGIDAPVSHYRVLNPIQLGNLRDDVRLWGYGTRITMAGNGNHHATFLLSTPGVENATFAGFELYGANAAYSRTNQAFSGLSGENASGIQMRDHHIGTTMEDIWAHHHNGDCIQQVGWAQYKHYLTRDTTVRYSLLEDAGRMGINPNVGTDWDIHHVIMGNHAGRNINAEDVRESNYPPGQRPRLSMDIHDNTFGPSGWQYNVFGPMVHIYIHAFTTFAVPPEWDQLGPFVIHDNLITGMQPIGAPQAGGRAFYSNMSWPSGGGNNVPVAGVTIQNNVAAWAQSLPSGGNLSAVRIAGTDIVTVTNNAFDGLGISAPTSGADANGLVVINNNS